MGGRRNIASAPSSIVGLVGERAPDRSANMATAPHAGHRHRSASTRMRASVERSSRRTVKRGTRFTTPPCRGPAAPRGRRVLPARSCVTSTSVVPCSQLSENISSTIFGAGISIKIAGLAHRQRRRFPDQRRRPAQWRRAAARRRRCFEDDRRFAQAHASQPTTASLLGVAGAGQPSGSITFSSAVSAGSWNDAGTQKPIAPCQRL